MSGQHYLHTTFYIDLSFFLHRFQWTKLISKSVKIDVFAILLN